MSTKQFTVRMESQGGTQVKSELAGIGETGKAAHEKISQGARESRQSTEQMTQEQARAVRALQQLKASIDPAYAAQLKYDGAVKQVQRATALGIASKEEEARVLQQLRAQYDQNIAAMQRGAAQTAAIGRASGASASQVANLGAQFNDIGVMLAAGQSPLQLAVQQGSQINQVFAQMGGGAAALRGVAAGFASMINPMSLATIGIIAGGAALFQWAQSAIAARNDTVDMEEAVDNLLATVSEVSSYNETARQSLAELRKEFGDNAAAVRDNAQALRDLAAVKAMTALEDTVRALSGSVSEAIVEFERLEGLTGRNAGPGGSIRREQIAALAEEVGFTADEARRLRDAFADLASAEGLDGATAAAQALYDRMIDIFGSAQDIPPELQEAARQALQAANAGYDIEAAMNASANAAGNASADAGVLSGQLSVAATYAAQLAANLSAAPAGIANFQQEAERLTAQIAALDAGYDTITASAAGYRKELEQKYGLAEAGSAAEDAYISAVINRQVKEFEGVQRLKEEYSDKASAIQKVASASGASGGASRAAEAAARSAVEQLQRQIDLDRELIGLSDEMTAEIKARQRVEEALAQDKLTWNEQAIQGLTDQIILNQQLRKEAELTSGVLRTIFDGLAKGDLRSIGSGLLGMAQNSFSDLLQTSFAKGGSGLKGLWDGITGGFKNIGAAFSGAGGGLAGIGSAISGLLPGIGAISSVVGVVQSFIGTTTKLTNALEGTLGIAGLLRGTEYDIKQKDNIFGSKTEKNAEEIFGSWAKYIAQDLDQEFRDMVQNTRDGIRALGLEIDEAFTYDFDVQFDESLPHEQLMERLRQELDKANDELLRTSLAAAGLARDGETGAQTLLVLNDSLQAANGTMRLFNQTLFDVSAIGAGAARELVEVAGGLDAFTQKTTFVFENFLTESEKTARGLQIATENMAAFEAQTGITLPETHAQFMALLDAQDLTTAEGRNLYAALLDVADEFVTVNGVALDAAAAVEDTAAAIEDVADAQVGLEDAYKKAVASAERREEIEARRAAQEAEFAKAQEAFADTVPLLAKQVSNGLLTIEQAAGGFGEEAVKQIEDAIGSMSALDLINARFNDPVYENGQGNPRLKGFEVFERAQQDVRDTFQSVAAGLIEPFEGLAQRVGAGIAGVNTEFGLNINAVQNTIASLESLGNAREGEIEALREVVDEYENAQRRLAEGAAQMSQEIGRYLEMGVSEIVDTLGDSAFEQATSSIGQLRDVVNALGGSAANTRVALMELAAAEEAYGVNFDKRKLVVGAALENAEARIAEVVKAPFEAALDTLVPELEALAGQFTTPILGIINEVDADDIDSYSDAFVRLTDLFTSGQVGVEAYEQSLSLLDLAMDGFDDGVKASIRGINSSLSEAQQVLNALNSIDIPSDVSDPVALGQAFQAMRHAMGGLRYELEQGGEVSALFEEYLGSVFDFSAFNDGDAAAKALEFDDALRGLMNGLEVELAALQPAADGATDAVEGLSDAARELESLQERFSRLTAELAGPEAVQEYEISKLLSDDAKALQRDIFDLEKQLADAAEAARQAEAALQQENSLKEQLATLRAQIAGQDAERQLELDRLLSDSARETQRKIYALNDAIDATAEEARQAEAVLQERLGLENQLLQLQGDTTELRRRELEALDPSNRALQEQIYAIQDLQAAEESFASARSNLTSALDAESAALRQSVDEARNALAASLDAETQRLEGVLSGLQSQRDSLYDQLFPQEAEQNGLEIRDLLSEGLALAEQLAAIARDVLGQNVEIAEQQREAALRQLQGMLAAGAIDVDNVQDIARRASEFNSRQYATLEDMQFDQLVTANTITELSKLQEKLAQEAQAKEEARVAKARDLAFDQLDRLDQQIVEQQNALARLNDIREQNGIAVDTLLSIAEAQVKFDQAKQYAATRETQLEAIRAEFGILGEGIDQSLQQLAAAVTAAVAAASAARGAGGGSLPGGGGSLPGGGSIPGGGDFNAELAAQNNPVYNTIASEIGGGSTGVQVAQNYYNDVVSSVQAATSERDAAADYLYMLQSTMPEDLGMSRSEVIRAINQANLDVISANSKLEANQNILSSIPSYANGTDYHPGGWAKLHENEMVNLPRGTSVSTASEVRQMAEQNKRLERQNEQNAAELRQMRRFLKTLADIEEDRRAEELAKAQEEAAA